MRFWVGFYVSTVRNSVGIIVVVSVRDVHLHSKLLHSYFIKCFGIM